LAAAKVDGNCRLDVGSTPFVPDVASPFIPNALTMFRPFILKDMAFMQAAAAAAELVNAENS
jgi:hypothetical protein